MELEPGITLAKFIFHLGIYYRHHSIKLISKERLLTFMHSYAYLFDEMLESNRWNCSSHDVCVCVCVCEREREREREREGGGV